MNLATFENIQETVNYLLGRVDINTNLGAVVHLLHATGLRINEACELKRFTLDTTTFVVDTEKKSYNRIFPLALLPSAYLPLLPYSPGFGVGNTISSCSSVTRFVLLNSTKVFYKSDKNITSNIFRYHFARNLLQEGYTVEQIQIQMGHSNLTSTLSYLAPIYFR